MHDAKRRRVLDPGADLAGLEAEPSRSSPLLSRAELGAFANADGQVRVRELVGFFDTKPSLKIELTLDKEICVWYTALRSTACIFWL